MQSPRRDSRPLTSALMIEDSHKNLTRTAIDHFGRVNYRVDVSGVSKLFPLPVLVLCLCTGVGNPNKYLPKIGLLSMIGLGSCHSYAIAIKCWYNGGHIEFCICVCVRAFAFSRMHLSHLRDRDMDAFVRHLVHLDLQTPVNSPH